MASTHLWAFNGLSGADWSDAGVKCRNLWVWDGSAWRPVIGQWIWDGSSWRRGYDPTPGPLTHVTISPASASVPDGGTQGFSVLGWDADERFIDVTSGGHSISWQVDTLTDSIDSGGFFRSSTFGSPGPHSVTVSVTVDGVYGASASVDVT